MTERETVDVELSREDRALILLYGYPFKRIEAAIKEVESRHGIENVFLDRFELKHLLRDLWISIKESRDESLRDKLDDLFVRLESAEKGVYPIL